MKTLFLILSLIISANLVNAQKYEYVNKIDRHVTIVGTGELYGMTYDKKLILPVVYHGIDQMYDGFYLFQDSLSGFADNKGKIIIPLDYYSIEPYDDHFIMVFRAGGETALYNYKGDLIIPFGKHEMYILERSIIVDKGQQALYSTDGSVIIPFGDHTINSMDDYGDIISVTKDGKTRIRVNKNMKIIDGYVPVNSELFTKTTEVSISEYFSFVAHQRMNSMLTTALTFEEIPYTTLLPDTNMVEPKLRAVYRNFMLELAKEEGYKSITTFIGEGKNGMEIEVPFAKNKAQMKMLDFPVTGVTKEQAEYYANWLNVLSAEELTFNDYGYLAVYRLPSENEWITIAESGLNESMRQKHVLDSLNEETCMLYIYKSQTACKGYDNYLKASYGGGSVPIKSMNKDLNGAYQFFGNVAEMVQEKGIAKGGSYFHDAKKAATTEIIKYSKPQPWLGFRVVAELGVY